jgi:hypothetical protein
MTSSTGSTSESLSKAYRLIEAEELGAARAILQPILARDPDNVDAWWLYAHAVHDTAQAREALDNVLRLEPSYPGAVDLSDQLDQVTGGMVLDLDTMPTTAPALVTEDTSEMPDLDDDLENDARRSRLIRIGLFAAIVVIVLVVVAGLFARNNTQPVPTNEVVEQATLEGGSVVSVPSPTVETGNIAAVSATEEPTTTLPIIEPTVEIPTVESPTIVAAVPTQLIEIVTQEPTAPEVVQAPTEIPTEIPTEAPLVEATTQPEPEASSVPEVTLEPATGDFAALLGSLSSYAMPSDPIGAAQTTLGRAFIVSACASAGQGVRVALPVVMSILSAQVNQAAAGYDAIGTRLVNCDTGRTLAIIVAGRDAAQQYATGQMTQEQFEAGWEPQ